MRLVSLATCNLNQLAMDFTGNTERIWESIRQAKLKDARYRVGPELEITGYSCEDHFLEEDTCTHAWEALYDIMQKCLKENVEDMVLDIGMPIFHKGVRYNCRIFILGQKILLIRPKMALANDGNYRETRYFATWTKHNTVEQFPLPALIRTLTNGQTHAPFGDAVLQFEDTCLASETCEELFAPASPHINLALNGVEIFTNGSGSHHQLRKLDQRMELIQSATRKCGGVYLYANQRGCDGTRLYFDGCACAVVNGDMLKQGDQFGLKEVETLVVGVDLDQVTSFRGSVASMQVQMSNVERCHFIEVPFKLSNHRARDVYSDPIEVRYHAPEHEIAYGPACWLWDYLRRSGASGFLLPLSGGADSASTAAIVGAMTQQLADVLARAKQWGQDPGNKSACEARMEPQYYNDQKVVADLSRILRVGQGPDSELWTMTSQDIASHVFSTLYLGTVNSSNETCKRSALLADQVGSKHLEIRIDTVVAALIALFTMIFPQKTPKFKIDGGEPVENLALQNIQARIRMVVAFLFAQLLPWARGQAGFLLVLGSANVDEGLRGYLTKYDCSSADINPIGGISKTDIRRFLVWGSSNLGYSALADVEKAPPTAELEPLRAGHVQTDEEDMGMTYEELTRYGRLRKIARMGPVSMYKRLLVEWGKRYTPLEIAEKVKKFFRFYSINRHKMTTITPSYHAENYSPDDNRFDLRQFLYNVRWPFQFSQIDKMAKVDNEHEKDQKLPPGTYDADDTDLKHFSGNNSGLLN